MDATRPINDPLVNERAVEIFYRRGSHVDITLDEATRFSINNNTAVEGNILQVRFIQPPAIQNVPFVAFPFQFLGGRFLRFPGQAIPTINTGAGESTVLRFLRTNNAWYHLGRIEERPANAAVDATARAAAAAAQATADIATTPAEATTISNTRAGLAITAHVGETDPHGDRAWAQGIIDALPSRFETTVGASPATLPVGTYEMVVLASEAGQGTTLHYEWDILVSNLTATDRKFAAVTQNPTQAQENHSVFLTARYNASTRALTYSIGGGGVTLDNIKAIGES